MKDTSMTFPLKLQLEAYQHGGVVVPDPNSDHEALVHFVQALTLNLFDFVSAGPNQNMDKSVSIPEGHFVKCLTISLVVPRLDFKPVKEVRALISHMMDLHPVAKKYFASTRWPNPYHSDPNDEVHYTQHTTFKKVYSVLNVRLFASKSPPLPIRSDLMLL